MTYQWLSCSTNGSTNGDDAEVPGGVCLVEALSLVHGSVRVEVREALVGGMCVRPLRTAMSDVMSRDMSNVKRQAP